MGTRQRRAREREKRRQTIVDAARSLFFKNGYDGTTVPDIAREAELAPGTIYLYFLNKDSLYAELLLDGYGLLEKRLIQAAQKSASWIDQANDLIDAFFQFSADCPEYFDIIFFMVQRERNGGWADLFDTEQLLRLEARLAACKTIFKKVLENSKPGSSRTGIRSSVDTVWTMLFGVVFFFKRKRATASQEEMTAEAKRLILNGLTSVSVETHDSH